MPTGTPERLSLIADIGGTYARFALGTSIRNIEHVRMIKVADFATIEQAIRHYLHMPGMPAVTQAVIGIATPVLGDHIKMTNSPWEFSIKATRQALGLEKFHVINDFTALALALPHLPPSHLLPIGGGQAVPGTPLGLLGPGTGLGISALIPGPNGLWVPLAAEGGHASFAPRTTIEYRLWQAAHQEFGHVSMERLLSGAGLQLIYRTLAQHAEAPAQDYTPADISRQALESGDSYCRQALDAFCAILGTAASDLALILGARGGIYLGGGIIPKLGDYFALSPFRARFNDKGRLSDYMAAIPVFVIANENPTLLGAAAYLATCTDDIVGRDK